MKKIFSGNASRKFWNAVNKAEPTAGVLYDYGCKAQVMEAEVIRLREELKQLKKGVRKVTNSMDLAHSLKKLEKKEKKK